MSSSKRQEVKHGEDQDDDSLSRSTPLTPTRSVPGTNVDLTKPPSLSAKPASSVSKKTYSSSLPKEKKHVATLNGEDHTSSTKPNVPEQLSSEVTAKPELIPETTIEFAEEDDILHQKPKAKASHPLSNTGSKSDVATLPGAVAVGTPPPPKSTDVAAKSEAELVAVTQIKKSHDDADLKSKEKSRTSHPTLSAVATLPGAVSIEGFSKSAGGKTTPQLEDYHHDDDLNQKRKYDQKATAGETNKKGVGYPDEQPRLIYSGEDENIDSENRPGAFSIEGIGGETADTTDYFESVEHKGENASTGSDYVPSVQLDNEQSSSMHLISATMVEDPEIWEAEAVSEAEVQQKKRHLICCIMGGFIILNAVMLGSVLPKVLNRKPAPSPTPSPTLFPTISPSSSPSAVPTTNVRARLESLISKQTIDAFDDESSPQYQALLWIEGGNTTYFTNLSDGRLTQRFALVTLFYSTHGDNWINSDGWLSSTNECNWQTSLTQTLIEAITTDKDQCYGGDEELFTSLEFTFNRMSGQIPPEISLLSTLEKIDLSNNVLTGQIPSELGLLNRMTELILAENSISGTIPSEIGMLSSIRTLQLSSNNLHGTIPSTLVNSAVDLQFLQLDDNNLSGQLVSEIGMLKQLDTISLSQNTLDGPIPSELGQLELRELLLDGNTLSGTIPFGNTSETPPLFGTLRHLGLSDNFLQGYIPTEFGLLTNVRSLYIQKNQLSGPIPTEFAVLEDSIRELSLGNNELSGFLPQEIWELTNLNTLDLSYNPFLVGSISKNIGDMTALNQFELIYTALTGTIPTSIGLLSRLERLNLVYNTQLQGTIPTEIGLLTGLEYLHIGYHMSFDQSAFPTEIGSLTALQQLLISYNRCTGEYPTEIGLLTRLEYLSMSYNFEVGGSIPSEIALLTNLELLSFMLNYNIGGLLPTELGLLTSLNTLHLEYTGILQIPSEFGQLEDLEVLDLSYTFSLEGPIPSELGLLENLNTFNLFGSSLSGTVPSEVCALTDQGLQTLIVECGSVQCSCCDDCDYNITNPPTNSPTVVCASGDMEIRLEINTDMYPEETIWRFVDELTEEVLFSGGDYNEKYTNFVHYFCVPADSCTIFGIFDTVGDGFQGSGGYSFFADNELVATVNKSKFKSQEQVRFGDCSPTAAPTTSPTLEPLVCDTGFSSLRVDIITDDYPQETTWAIFDEESYEAALPGLEETIALVQVDTFEYAGTKYTNDTCLFDNECYIFVIVDSYSDGICCSGGLGRYTLTLDGEIIATGGEFEAREIVEIGSCNSDTNDAITVNPPVEPPADQYSCEPGFEVFFVKIEFENDSVENSTVWAVLDSTSDTTLLEGNGPSVSSEGGTAIVIEEGTCVSLSACTVFTISGNPDYEGGDIDGEQMGVAASYSIYMNDAPVAIGTYLGTSETLHRFGDCLPY